MHAVLELGADQDHLSEQRLFAEVEGWTISGGIDLQKLDRGSVGIRDYKLCSVWSLLNPKPAWERQLNCYAWLVRTTKGWDVADLEVLAVCRDWSRAEASRRNDYPQSPVSRVPLRLWSETEADAYVKGRVQAHQDAQRARDWGEPLPLCDATERWDQPSVYAVMKPGRKRALKLFDDLALAEAHAATIPTSTVVTRPGESVRCAGDYCQVARWCDQRAAQLAQAEASE